MSGGIGILPALTFTTWKRQRKCIHVDAVHMNEEQQQNGQRKEIACHRHVAVSKQLACARLLLP